MLKKGIIQTVIYIIILFLFIIFNTKLDLSKPLDIYEEFIIIDDSSSYDLLRLADLDENSITYGFYSNEDTVITIMESDFIIQTIIYDAGSPAIIDIDIDDLSLLNFHLESNSFSEIIEVVHISEFETYEKRLLSFNSFEELMDDSLYHKETVFLDLLDTTKALFIAIGIVLFTYLAFIGLFDLLFKRIKLYKLKKWITRIIMHLLSTVLLYGLIVFILVAAFGDSESEFDYDTINLYESQSSEYEFTAYISLVKVNGISKDALQVVYQFDLKEKKDYKLVAQLYCDDVHIGRILGYKVSSELDHYYQDVFPSDYCSDNSPLTLMIYNNRTGSLIDSYNDIPLYMNVDDVVSTYNLEYSNLGNYFSIGILLVCGLILVPIGEYLIIKFDRKKNENVSNA